MKFPEYSNIVKYTKYPDNKIIDTCLLIMNPRRIDSVIDSVKNLNIKKTWFTGFNSLEIGPALNEYVNNTKYDRYIVMSDDIIINKTAFTNIIENMKNYDVLTGYCNIHIDSEYVSLTQEPLTLKQNDYPRADDYKLMKLIDVLSSKETIIETYLISYTITSITRDIWNRFPFIKYVANARGKVTGVSSDHNFSYRLSGAGVKMYAHRDAFCYHLKGSKGQYIYGKANMEGWLVGKVKPQIIEE